MATADAQADVVIIGGAMMGASVAWHLRARPDFGGRVVIVERDPTFAQASTSHTNSCMRQQFSSEINIRISQYCAAFIRSLRPLAPGAEAPEIHTDPIGYLYLAADRAQADGLRAAQALQARLGAGTRIMGPADIAARWPFLSLSGVVLGSFNDRDEGYFDGGALFQFLRRDAARAGVETWHDEAVGIDTAAGAVTGVRLRSGRRIACSTVVNAAGPRAAAVAAMAGLRIPVEPRKRYTWVIAAARPLPAPLPLTVDPSGVHMRSDGAHYMIGAAPEQDGPVAPDDFAFDHGLWERRVWPAIAARVPAFETVRVLNAWVGHYAWNRLDRNAIVGPHPELAGFHFVNGFSGHGLQQAPAMGRGLAELICTGRYETLDLSPLGVARVLAGRPLPEAAVI